jgi:hypothetical protein
VNTHPSPNQKFTTEQQSTATPFATNTGIPARPTNKGINPRFPTIDTAPFEK